MKTDNTLNIEAIVVGPFQVNCYIASTRPDSAIVIDPGEDAADIIEHLKSHNMSVIGYLLTHGHVDHVSALAEVHDAYPAPIAVNENDLEWAVKDGDQLDWGGLSIQVIDTPGHSPGGVCYYFNEQHTLFAGDTLFKGSVGRTDLPGGSGRTLANSLIKLKALPGETVVYSGHGPASTIEFERRTNFFMQ